LAVQEPRAAQFPQREADGVADDVAAYMVTGFTVAGVYAAGILRGRRDRYHYTGASG
jgi:hypothetical protein